MIINNLFSNSLYAISFIIALLIALSVHESAHAWMANRLGDQTAKSEGRLTLNPLAHLDLVGTIFLFLVGLGWGKPVPVNYHNLKNPRLDGLKIALSGPISNLLTAIIFALLWRIFGSNITFSILMYSIIQLNLVLMVFNLIPIPPLDGANILPAIFSDEINGTIQQLSLPLLIVFIIFIFSTNYVSQFIKIVTDFFIHFLTGY